MILPVGQHEVCRQDAGRLEPPVGIDQPERAADQEAGRHEQHERERHFGDHERRAHPRASRRRRASAFLERLTELGLAPLPRGRQAEYQAGQNADGRREGEDAAVDVDVVPAVDESADGGWHALANQVDSDRRDEQRKTRADEREDDAFRQ